MHTIFSSEAREARSPMLQMVHELEFKRRSYGRLKTTASSCEKISQLRNQPFVAKISQLRNQLAKISQGVLQL